MAAITSIEWTESTWNPVVGCTKISQGCKYCYAARLAERLQAMGNPRYRNAFNVTLHPDLVDLPLKWTRPRMVFVNSMSDLFHELVPASFVESVFSTIQRAYWHTFQILTKRPERAVNMADTLHWPRNLWMGTTVESEEVLNRVAILQQIPSQTKFLSLEPLLGPISHLPLDGIDWVIVGGESGPHARPMNPDWVRAIRDLCNDQQVPFFFKQWGGVNKAAAGRTLDDRIWSEMPKTFSEGKSLSLPEDRCRCSKTLVGV